MWCNVITQKESGYDNLILYHSFFNGTLKPFYYSKDMGEKNKNLTIARRDSDIQRLNFTLSEELDHMKIEKLELYSQFENPEENF